MSLEYLAIPPAERNENSPPVLLILHGYGANEQDLLFLQELVPPTFLTISLRAPISLPWGGYAWYHLGQNEHGLVPDDESRHESESLLVSELKSIIERESGNPADVLLAGFSQGAAMSYSLLGAHDLRGLGIQLRGILIMSGYIPRDIVDAFGRKRYDGLNAMLTHGEFDDLIAPAALEEAASILERQGARVEHHIYPCGHGLLPETIDDIRRWIHSLSSTHRPVFL